MKIKLYLATTIAVLGIVAGCASDDAKLSIVSGNDGSRIAEKKLTSAATSINQSLQELAGIERAVHPQAKLPAPIDPDAIDMAQLSSIDWTGPIGPLVKKIAAASNYKVHTLGTPPAIPIIVAVSAKDIPLADILRDAGFQCGAKANIAVYPAHKIIELRYKKT